MKKLSKSFGAVITFLVLCLFILNIPLIVKAETMTTIYPNKEFQGALETKETVHYYAFTVDKTGYFNIEFGPVDFTQDIGYGWRLELCDGSNGKSIYSTTIETFQTLPTFNFKQGTKLYLKVQNVSVYSSTNGQKYSINIKTVQNIMWEQESNNTISQATKIVANKKYFGNCYNEDDVDYFKYTVGTTGYEKIYFGVEDLTAETNYGWKISVYNAVTKEELFKYQVDTKETLGNFNFKKGTTLYIKVEVANRYGAPKFVPYSLKIGEVSTNYWEKESFISSERAWSTRAKNATTLNLNKSYYGNLWNKSDNDLYKVTTTKNGYLTLKFNTNDLATNLGYGYKLRVYSSTGSLINEQQDLVKVSSKKYYVKKGTYYVEIQSAFTLSDSVVLKDYIVSTSFTESNPGKVTGLKAAKTKLSWKKISSVSGYQIEYSTRKDFKNATKKSTTKTTYTLSGLKTKTVYYVRVCSYRKTATGSKVYGAYSSTIKVKK